MYRLAFFLVFSFLCACSSSKAVELAEAGTVKQLVASTASIQVQTSEPVIDTTEQLVLSAVGDCALGDVSNSSGAPGSFRAELRTAPDPMAYPFSGVSKIFASDDLTVANLEGTLTDHHTPQNLVLPIRGKPAYARMLVRGHVDLVNLANNHSHDYGPRGYADTRKALSKHEVGFFGRTFVDRRKIKSVQLINLGYLGGMPSTMRRMTADVAREKGPGRVVVVSFHWGVEAIYAIHPEQRRLGRAAIDAGAALVLGHHPHVLQGIETYKERHIVYSLGNFVFGANSQPRDMDSIIYQEHFQIDAGELVSVKNKIIPVRISSRAKRNDFRPMLLEGEERRRVLAKVERLSDGLSTRPTSQ